MISNGFFYLIIFFCISLNMSTDVLAQNLRRPAEENELTDLFYICKRDGATRWLRAYKLENGKCNTIYSKEGYLQNISSASYFSSCEAVLHSVQKNLVEGGFKCVATSKYAVTELE
jgi:hypothetical protein